MIIFGVQLDSEENEKIWNPKSYTKVHMYYKPLELRNSPEVQTRSDS